LSAPTFIVGTGRCGSTMLSNMLREHPQVLSLSEFFAILVDYGFRIPETFAPEPIDGQRFWGDIVAAITPHHRFAYRHRVACDEMLYPFQDPAARFSSETGVPAILQTTLPHLTSDHDKLFDLLQAEVIKWPQATKSEHYRRLFSWLTGHFGTRLWIERSGAALHMLEHIIATFPEARFIHLARDGRDAVISMQAHLGMRLYFVMSTLGQYLGVDPMQSPDRANIDRVPEAWRPLLPEQFDADAFRAFRVPLSIGTEFWRQQIDSGLKVLSAVPANRLLTLRYEDFFTDAKAQLETLAAFLGEEFVDEDWSTRCAATVRKPRSTWRDLPEAEGQALTEACRPGFDLLREIGVHYDV
jgi:putative sulfotransferase